MTEQTVGADAQGAEAQEPQGGTAPAQGATPQPAHGASGTGEVTVESLTAKLSLLEKDNQAYRKREREREEAEKAKATAELSATEQLQARVAELEQQLSERTRREQEQSLRLASVTAATKLGYRNPDIAYRLLDAAAVEYAEDGNPRNVEQLLIAVAKSDPYLLAQTDFGGGQRGSSAAQGNDMNTLIRRAAAGRR